MDNTNQNNTVGDFTGMNPPTTPPPLIVTSSPTPIDITPTETQSSSSTMPTMDSGTALTSSESYQPENKSSASPIFTPPTIELTPSNPQLEKATVTPLPTVTEPETLQQSKLPTPKKVVSPAIMGVLIVLFLGVASGGVFVVSRAVSGQASVAPTAPDSEPRAFDPAEMNSLNTTDVAPDCSTMPNTAPYGNECRTTLIDANGNVMWAPEATNPNTSAPEVNTPTETTPDTIVP